MPRERTQREADFLVRALAPPPSRVLDVCCGLGRHMHPLVERGYDCVGVEVEPGIAAEARASGLDVRELDIRDLRGIEGDFEGVLSMWASFGWFDEETNAFVLGAMCAKVRPGGVLVLDVWMPEFFATRQGVRQIRTGIRESKVVRDGRLYVEYNYGERFDWRLYEPDELVALSRLELVTACSEWNESQRPSPDVPRYQLVLAKRA